LNIRGIPDANEIYCLLIIIIIIMLRIIFFSKDIYTKKDVSIINKNHRNGVFHDGGMEVWYGGNYT
jgi:hypothetical protein